MARLALCLLALTSLTSLTQAESPDHWLNNLGKAQAEARSTNRPIMVVFRCER